jgi:hypothetical protein
LSADTLTTQELATRRKSPKHPGSVIRADPFPLDVTPKQGQKLLSNLNACWKLRNGLAIDRMENWKANRRLKQQGITNVYDLTQSDQYKDLKQYPKNNPELQKIHSQVLQNTAVRINEGCERSWRVLEKRVQPPKEIPLKRY